MTKEQMELDIKFLLERSMNAGDCTFSNERDTGVSSNSIVAIAYGVKELNDQEFPGDIAGLNACRRMWDKLPEHRKTFYAKVAMQSAEARIESLKNGRG